MPTFDPKVLAADCGGVWRPAPPASVAGFSTDTRTLRRGEVFVALRAARRDGHDFVADAASRGAAAAIVSREVAPASLPQLVVPDTLAALQALAAAHRRRFAGRIVGVTGSAGKTSTKDLLAVLLGPPERVLATEGNLNNHLGVPLTLLRLDRARHELAVVELGISGPGEMDVIGALVQPDVALVTTVGPAHLDRLVSVEGVAQEKARLAEHLRPGGVALFLSAALGQPAFAKIARSSLVAVPQGAPTPDVPAPGRVVPVAFLHEGAATRVCVTWHGAVERFDLRRVTPGMASNAALALIAALFLGIDAEVLRGRLPGWRPAALRGEVRRVGDTTIYLDCYNANPASMADALEGFVATADPAAPRLFIVGCMEELGTETEALHRETGARWPLRPGDRLVVFGTQAAELAAGARSVAPAAEILVNPGRAAAAALLRGFRGAVFVKGSRLYALEDLLEESGATAPHGREAAA